MGILTVGVVTKPFHFEGMRRMRTAESGIAELHKVVDTLLIIPNQNLFRVANEKTTFADAFAMADQVLYSGVACITDLMVKEGLINLDFADVRAVMREMGKAMMGTGEATGEKPPLTAAEPAIANPLIADSSRRRAPPRGRRVERSVVAPTMPSVRRWGHSTPGWGGNRRCWRSRRFHRHLMATARCARSRKSRHRSRIMRPCASRLTSPRRSSP